MTTYNFNVAYTVPIKGTDVEYERAITVQADDEASALQLVRNHIDKVTKVYTVYNGERRLV